jgi:hypothetical protein
MTPDALTPPEHGALVEALKKLRAAGIVKLRDLDLPDLTRATVAAGLAEPERAVEPAAIERLLVEAIERLGGGELEQAAARLFGLEPGTRGRKPWDLRDLAAEVYDHRSRDTFRINYEPTIIGQVAEAILGLCHDFRLRLSRLNLERRAPAATLLAVEWVKRFEAYYSMWTPISGLAGDLDAYYATLAEEEEPPAWWSPQGEGDQWDVRAQAEGYARAALFHFARLLYERERFVRRFGGLWLASSQESEQLMSNSVHSITLWSPFNERDDSYLRQLVDQADGEYHAFLTLLASDAAGQMTHREWLDWAAHCTCGGRPSAAPDCRGHRTIEECRLYMRLTDDEWEKIADWYHLEPTKLRPMSPEEIYETLAGDLERGNQRSTS